MKSVVYIVNFVTVVDRPDLRGETYPVVKPGTTVSERVSTLSRSSAASLVNGILAGEEDFSSEYVKAVQAWSENVRTGRTRTLRTLRRRDGRDRPWREEV